MKVLLVIPDPAGNPGDEVICRGILTLIERNLSITSPDYYYFESEDEGRRSRNESVLETNFDVLIISGTPWLWDLCTYSNKYRELRQLIAINPSAKLIALGIGACVPIHCGAELICDKADVVADLKDIWGKFALITTRDKVASETLSTCAIPHVSDYCPSILAFPSPSASERRIVSRRSALVFYLPQAGISRESLSSAFIEHYVDMQIALARSNNFDLACLLPVEKEYLSDRLGVAPETVELLTSASDILRFVKCRPLVITGRVHVAIPTHIGGGTACLMPVDTRYLTAMSVGVHIFWRYGPYFPAAKLKPRLLFSFLRKVRKRDLLLPLAFTSILSRLPDIDAYQDRMGQLLISATSGDFKSDVQRVDKEPDPGGQQDK